MLEYRFIVLKYVITCSCTGRAPCVTQIRPGMNALRKRAAGKNYEPCGEGGHQQVMENEMMQNKIKKGLGMKQELISKYETILP